MPLVPLLSFGLGGGPPPPPPPPTIESEFTVRFAYENAVAQFNTVLAASSSMTGFPASNLNSTAPWLKWKSLPQAANQWVTADFGSSKNIRAMLLKNVVLHPGGTVRLQAHDSTITPSTTPAVDELITIGAGNTGVQGIFIGLQSYRYARILFENPTLASASAEVGVWFVGDYYQPERSIAAGWSQKRLDLSVTSRSTGGQRSTERRQKYWRIDARFDAEPESERDEDIALLDATGNHTPLFFAIDPRDPSRFVFYGRFEDEIDLTNLTIGYYSQSFAFTEDL